MVGDLVAWYLEGHVAVRCKPTKAAMHRLIVKEYIIPELGWRPALAVGHGDPTDLSPDSFRLVDKVYDAE